MTALLGFALLVTVSLLVPATVLIFTVSSDHARHRAGSVSAGAALALATALLALLAGALWGGTPAWSVLIAAVLGASVLAWWPVGRAWDVRGLLVWALTVDAGVLYLGYVLDWTMTASVGALGLIASLALWLLELFVFVIGVGYVWEFVDVLARRSWPGRIDPRALPPQLLRGHPFVSLHVPTHNEPPDMVIETLERLLLLDYDDYEILLVDNNTTDPALWQPVEAFCARHARIKFLHLENWPGFKSGALNHALTVTDPRADVIGIVDADYRVESSFLAECAPLFGDPAISFVQTPQDYRDWRVAPYFRRLYYSYGYFFDVSQRSRNERNGAIFGGTMGLIRRSALEAAGGWDEWCITEDAELSLRLLKAGGRGIHIDRSYGYGVMPLTFEALKRQRFRWCFGGVQILRLHWRSLLPGRRTDANRLGPAQRWAYLVGGIQWFGDLASMLFTVFLVAGAVDAALGEGVVVRRLSGLILLSVVALVVLGAIRSLALVRRTSGARWGEALGAFGLWLALGWTVARASTLGLFSKEGVFLRTPKVRGEPSASDAVRGNLSETLLAVACLAIGGLALARHSAGSLAVGGLLLVQAVGFAAAPLNSLAAIRSDLPEELRRRRRELLPSWGRLARPARRGAFVLVAATAVASAFVVFAAPTGGPDLSTIRERVDQHADTPQPAVRPPSRRVSPSSEPSTSAVGAAATTASSVVPPASATPTRAAQQPSPAQATPAHPTATRPTQVPTTAQPTAQPTAHPSATQPTQAPATQPTRPAAASTHPTGRP